MGQKTVNNDNHDTWKLFFDSELHDFGAVVILRVT